MHALVVHRLPSASLNAFFRRISRSAAPKLSKIEMFAYKRVGWGVLAVVCFDFPFIH